MDDDEKRLELCERMIRIVRLDTHRSHFMSILMGSESAEIGRGASGDKAEKWLIKTDRRIRKGRIYSWSTRICRSVFGGGRKAERSEAKRGVAGSAQR